MSISKIRGYNQILSQSITPAEICSFYDFGVSSSTISVGTVTGGITLQDCIMGIYFRLKISSIQGVFIFLIFYI